MRRFARAVGCVGALLVGLWVLGFALPGATRSPEPAIQQVPTAVSSEIWLLFGPIHTDIVIPVDGEARAAFGFADLPSDAHWLVIGWGSEAFYTSTGAYTDLSLRTVWTAAKGDAGVLRLLPLQDLFGTPETWGARVLPLTEGQKAQLLRQIAAQVTGPALPGVHLDPRDHFYPTDTRFGLWLTCNQWLNTQLRGVGLRLGVFTPDVISLRASLALFGG